MSTISQYRVPAVARRPTAHLAVPGASTDVLSRLGFVTFLLVNVTLFIRPAELLASLENWPIYGALIVLCLLASLPSVINELRPGQLKRWPINLCVVAVAGGGVSQITHLHFGEAATGGITFFKLVVYYLLLVVNLNSFKRLRIFLFSIMTVTLVMTTLSVLEYHQLINIPVLSAMHQRQSDPVDADSGDGDDLARLSSLGIFDNPNDLSRIVVVAVFLCMICLSERKFGVLRFLWAAPVAFLIYANVLTYSRGGFLGLVGGMGVQFLAQFGRWKTILLAGAVLPILLVVSAGRQTEISTNAETGHARILLWRDGFEAMHAAPIFGTGYDSYPTITGGLVAHNSFVHAFVELGLVGGTLFVGLFYFSIEPLYRVSKKLFHAKDREFYRLLPYIIAIVVSYGIGLLSSSRCYEVPTFMIIGLASVCARLVASREPGAVRAVQRSDAEEAGYRQPHRAHQSLYIRTYKCLEKNNEWIDGSKLGCEFRDGAGGCADDHQAIQRLDGDQTAGAVAIPGSGAIAGGARHQGALQADDSWDRLGCVAAAAGGGDLRDRVRRHRGPQERWNSLLCVQLRGPTGVESLREHFDAGVDMPGWKRADDQQGVLSAAGAAIEHAWVGSGGFRRGFGVDGGVAAGISHQPGVENSDPAGLDRNALDVFAGRGALGGGVDGELSRRAVHHAGGYPTGALCFAGGLCFQRGSASLEGDSRFESADRNAGRVSLVGIGVFRPDSGNDRVFGGGGGGNAGGWGFDVQADGKTVCGCYLARRVAFERSRIASAEADPTGE